MDELFGLVQVNGFTSAPLSWPTRKKPSGGPRTLALTEDLVRAIRSESAVAVAYWWNISTKTVRLFRRALDVSPNTPGTTWQRGYVAVLPPPDAAARGRAKAATDPDVLARLSEKRKGRKPSPEARQKMSAAARGKKKSPATRQKMSEAQRLRMKKTPDWGARAHVWMLAGKRKARED